MFGKLAVTVLSRGKTVLLLFLLSLTFLVVIFSQYQPFHEITPKLITSLYVSDMSQSTSVSKNTTIHSDRKQRFPQAIIIGVRKAGTRALINMLNLHPDVVSAREEIHYFDREENFDKGIQWYIDRMPYTLRGQVTIEKTPGYFVREEVPQRISMVSKNVKLLLIVRNPIDRTLSDFTQLDWKHKKRVGTGENFEDLAFGGHNGKVNSNYPPIAVSMYDVHFKKWLKYFQLSQILIVDGDAFIKSPVSELKMAESFLGINSFFQDDMFYFNRTKGFYCWKKRNKEVPTCLGSGKGREHPIISKKAESALQKFFRPHNEAFYSLIERRFDW